MKDLFLFFAALIFTAVVSAQGVLISPNNGSPDPSAILETQSTTQGLLPPRLTTLQRDAIQSPANGLLIWNVSSNCLDVYIVNAWQSLSCGCSGPPVAPGAITGSSLLCENATLNGYSISPVSFATSYTWTTPSGSIITSGQGTTSIVFDAGMNSGNVSVTANNNCGASAVSVLSVNVEAVPSTPGVISGQASVCSNSSGNVYSIAEVAGATSYNWVVPSGASITANTGNSVTVSFGESISGNLTVDAANSCGTSGASSLALANDYSTGAQTFNYTGAQQTFVVPACVFTLTIDAYGAQGSDPSSNVYGGLGGQAKGTLAVTPGQTLYVYVGGQALQYAYGFNGGGGGLSGGGGASDVRAGGSALTDRVIVAGGGGGSGYYNGSFAYYGGAGGANTGASGANVGSTTGGTGGSQVAGGNGGSGPYNGSGGTLGNGGNGGTSGASPNGLNAGGGGGGYYGGGGGGYSSGSDYRSAGGGGSNYLGGVSPLLNNAGVRAGSGLVTISW